MERCLPPDRPWHLPDGSLRHPCQRTARCPLAHVVLPLAPLWGRRWSATRRGMEHRSPSPHRSATSPAPQPREVTMIVDIRLVAKGRVHPRDGLLQQGRVHIALAKQHATELEDAGWSSADTDAL